MTHQEIEGGEVVERYVMRRLAPEERRAFQEHYFACDACFDEVQAAARFVAGVRSVARDGVLAARPGPSRDPRAVGYGLDWLKAAFALSAAASVLLAAGLAWVWFSRVPALREEAARERQARAEMAQASQQSAEAARGEAEEARRQLEAERAERARLAEELQARALSQSESAGGPERPPAAMIAQANVPLVTLDSTRDSAGAEHGLTVPPSAQSAVLWIPVAPDSGFRSFQVRVLTAGGRAVETVSGARPNRYGAVAVSVPASRLDTGKYVVRLYGLQGRGGELLGEYDLRVVKKQ